jgi:lysine-specific demethylase 3
MYSALRDRKGIGSTRLHMDVAPAFNVFAHAESQGCATWQIFARKDADSLAVWMRERYMVKGHPVHQQQVYLTGGDLADLWNEIQICPYTIHQRQSHIVPIPPGCPHQVGRIIPYMMCTQSLSICLVLG